MTNEERIAELRHTLKSLTFLLTDAYSRELYANRLARFEEIRREVQAQIDRLTEIERAK